MLGALAAIGAPAAAEPRDVTVRYGPLPLGPYEVKRGDAVFNIPKPDVDGFITRMHARLVYANGREVPIASTMLHHVVMADLGTFVGEHRDPTCVRFRMFELPPGFGYPTRAADRWAMTYMLMNHCGRRREDGLGLPRARRDVPGG